MKTTIRAHRWARIVAGGLHSGPVSLAASSLKLAKEAALSSFPPCAIPLTATRQQKECRLLWDLFYALRPAVLFFFFFFLISYQETVRRLHRAAAVTAVLLALAAYMNKLGLAVCCVRVYSPC